MHSRSPSHPPGPGAPHRRHAAESLPVMPLVEVRLDSQPRSHPLNELLQKEGAEAHLIACRLTERTPRRLIRWLRMGWTRSCAPFGGDCDRGT
jgi:hypothetical protein